MIIRSMIYGFSGMCMEIFFTGFLSFISGDSSLMGHTYLWMFPIYASAVFLEPVHDHLRLPFYVRGVVYLLLIWCMEFFSGFVIESITGRCPWDYSALTDYSFCGYIRWDFAPAWYIVGLLFEKFHTFLLTFTGHSDGVQMPDRRFNKRTVD